MPRVIGIDPGTLSSGLCGLDDGRLVLDESLPTAEALRDPAAFVARLSAAGPVDLIVGPSGYGLPCVMASRLTDRDVRLAVLAAEGDHGGIGGLGSLIRTLAASGLPVMFTPGVVHLDSVPAHRKINRVDMGTADKVCAVALAAHEHAERRRCAAGDTSFLLLELGGAFTAAIAVDDGRIVDGIGGSSGPLGFRAAGAFDGEVAYLAGRVEKSMIFRGGAAAVSGAADLSELTNASSRDSQTAFAAYVESAVKAVASMQVSAPRATQVMLSGRAARNMKMRDELSRRVGDLRDLSLEVVEGFATTASHAAQGAALIADGLAGGAHAPLVETLRLRQASGTVLDHLYVISRAAAEARLGVA
jgi:predicted butyrate kinase (DUF1464 family)